MNEEILKNIWEALSEEEATNSDFDTWMSNFSGSEEIQSNVHEYLIEKGYTESDFETWSTNVGLKKKDESQPTGEEEVMESDTEVVEEPILSESSLPEETNIETEQESQFSSDIPDPSTQPDVDQNLDEVSETITEEVQYDPMERGSDGSVTYSADATPFQRSLAYITGDLIEREEEEVVAKMKYHFTDYGFDFEETGIGDSMIVTADNGKVLEVDLDPFMGLRSEKTSNKLKEFLEKNKVVTPEMDLIIEDYDQSRKKYFSAEAMQSDIQDIHKQAVSLSKRYKQFLSNSNDNQAQIDALSELPQLTPLQAEQYNELIKNKSSLADQKISLQREFKKYTSYENQLNAAVGDYTAMKEGTGNKAGTLIKGVWNNFITGGITKPLASLVGLGYDTWYAAAQTINEDYGMTPEEKKERYITIATDLGYDVPENIEDEGVYNSWLEGMMSDTFEGPIEEGQTVSGIFPKEIQDQLLSEGYDPSRVLNNQMWKNDGGLVGGGYVDAPAYANDTTKGSRLRRLVLDQEVKENKTPARELIRNSLNFLAAEGVSDELKAKMSEESFIYEGLFGLAESGPSILLGFLGKDKSKSIKKTATALKKLKTSVRNYLKSPGAMAQTVSFSLLQTDALMEEMENDPDFKYVTETEKKAITFPLAISTAILERLGLRNIATNKTIVRGLMNQVTKMLPKGATPKMFTEMFTKLAKNNIAKGVYRVAGGALAEAETGALQQIAEIGMKNVWNDMYEKEMFKTPEMWSEEFGEQVIRAGLAEAVGGFVMSTPGALTTAFSKGDIDNIPDGMVELFNDIRNDKITTEAYRNQLDIKVANKEITKEEADQELMNFEMLSGAASTVDQGSELNEEQTKKALGLVFLKNKIENEMEGMDSDLGTYKAKQEILTKIKDKLSKIGTDQEESANLTETKEETTKTKEDAIQESSTESVDVQEQTEDGGAVGDGDTQTTVATESIQEEQTPVGEETQEEVTIEERSEQIGKLIEQEKEDSQTEPQPIPREQLEVVDEVVSINKAQQEVTKENPFKQGVVERVGKAAKALKKVIPNLKIIMHESATDFNKASGRTGRGALVDGVVHINLEKATNSTVAHEAFHIVLLSKLNTDKATQRVTKRMMESVAKALPKNDPLLKQINDFTQGYEANIQNEEKLAEILGQLSANYKTLSAPQKSVIGKWIDRIMKGLGINVSEFTQSDQDVIDLLNTLASKVTSGVEVEEGDIKVIEEIREDGGPTEQGDGGEVGTVKVREQKDSRNTPKVEIDTRPFAKLIKNKDLGDFDGQPFVTNMYDFTTAGTVDLGNGITINLFGGKSYVPYMMEKQGKNLGEISNVAAFNTKAQAESFIRNATEGGANLFMPHSGSTEGSWQFQQAIFEQITNAALNNKILSKKDIINSFNEVLSNAEGRKAFNRFKKKLGKNIRNFNSFAKDPLEVVRLLDIKNNYSPDLRKALNDKLVANKKFQEAIGVKSKEAFAKRMEDVLNKGVETGDIMSVIEFDNTNFEIRKPKPGDVDYHPSFAYTILSTIKGIYQPTKFYKSYNITDTYTKYNIGGESVSRKSKQGPEKFKASNVTSSAGAIPKVAQKKPAIREQKESKPTVEKLANFYAMDNKGFIKPGNVYDLDALRQFASRVGYKIKRHRGDSGATTMYSLRDANDRQFVPVKGTARTRFQKIMDKFDNPMEIIKLARQAGFEDKEISYFLKTKKGLKVKEIKDLMEIKVDIFESMPSIFGEIPGGLIAGRKLYEATMKKFEDLVNKNSKLPKGKQKTISSLINESIEFMMTLKAYKNATEGVQSKTLPSTLQQKLQASMQEALGGNEVKDISKTISNLKKLIREKIRGAREIRNVKRQLQRAIREIMPKSEYSKGEVMGLLRTIQEAEPAWLKGNLRNLIQQVEEMAAKKNVSILDAAIKKILSNNWVIKVNNQETGVKIDSATKKIIKAIEDKLYKSAEIKDDIEKEQTNILAKINEISFKTVLTEEDQTNLLILNTALAINNSKLMEDNNPRKADQLAEVYNNLKALILQGRNNYKEAAAERSKRYATNTAKFYQALTGSKKELDFTDPDVIEEIKEKLKADKDEKGSEKKQEEKGVKRIIAHFNNLGEKMMSTLRSATLNLGELTSTLDKLPGDVMGDGFIKDFVYRKVNESTRVYKESIMALNQLMDEKTEEFLGKDYKSKLKDYRKYLDFTQIEGGKFMKNPKAVKDAQDKYDQDPSDANAKALQKAVNQNIPFSGLTSMDLMYLYFQYKQKDTHAGFQTALGANSDTIMDGLSKYFEDNYPDLVELGEWHVNSLFPSLYEKYNKVYKKQYNTDLPQRENYAGRTFRQLDTKTKLKKIQELNSLALLNEIGTSQMSTNVIGNSTKLTVKNKQAIMPVDFFSAVDSYLKDMEHFSAYSENMNEISKVYFNEIIADEIINQYGKEMYETIRTALINTATRGSMQSDAMVGKVNNFNNLFVLQKLGAGLSIYLKQLTSMVAYGDAIGFRNWLKTAMTMGPKEFIKAWQEIAEDSVYIKYRYWENINKTIEAYGEKTLEEYTPGDKGDKLMRAFMSPIKAGDKQAIFMGGIPMYVFLKKKYEKTMTPEAAKKKALIMFEEQTKEVQQSSDKQDKDNLQNQGGYVQFFNMFMSAPKAYFRKLFGGYRELRRNIKDGSGKGNWWDNARTIALYQFGLPMIFQWATSGFPVTDWDDEDVEDLGRSAILSVFNSIFIVGQVAEGIANRYQNKPWWRDTKQFPVLELSMDVTDKIGRAIEEEDPSKSLQLYKEALYALLPLSGGVGVPIKYASMPMPTLDRMAQNLYKIGRSGGDPKEIFLRLFNYSDYIIEGGKDKDKPKKRRKLNKTEMRKYFPEYMEAMDDFNNSPQMKEFNQKKKDYKAQEKKIRQEMLDKMFKE
tara:strand:- start:11420 stop:20071 length:8652 start_codon:yes stop_codon:yes gene_type:complete